MSLSKKQIKIKNSPIPLTGNRSNSTTQKLWQIFNIYLLLPEANIYFGHVKLDKEYQICPQHVFEFKQKSYVFVKSSRKGYFIFDIDANKYITCDIDNYERINNIVVNQNFLYLRGNRHIYQLFFIGQVFKIKTKYHYQYHQFYQNVFINKSQDLVLENYRDKMHLKSFKLQKQIFSIHKQVQSFNYNSNNGFVIYQCNYPQNDYISIMNIRSRQIIFRCLGFFNVEDMIYVQNTEYILIQKEERLELYKINYQGKAIEHQKFISFYKGIQMCAFDDNNLLNLLSQKQLIIFDKFFNVIQRFEITFFLMDYDNLFYPHDYYISYVKIKNHLPELVVSGQYFYRQTQNFKQSNYIKFCEHKNYSIEYVCNPGDNGQILISPDQCHMAFIKFKAFMFHGIMNGVDIFLKLNEPIGYLSFSKDSNSLYVILNDRILCYKTKQNLKKSKCFHRTMICSQTMNCLQPMNYSQIKQTGRIIVINKVGTVIAINRTTKKMIFKFLAISNFYKSNSCSLDFESQKGTILVSSQETVSLFNLADRKLIINYTIENRQCKLIQNSQNLLILRKNEQLQLWSYANQFQLVQEQVVLGKVIMILQGFSEYYCLGMMDQIIVINQQFQIMEQIDYDCRFVQHEDEIIKKNCIVRNLAYGSSIFYDPQINFLQLEQRDNKK